MTLPISIVVPLSDRRNDVFSRFIAPALIATGCELVVEAGPGGAAEKRNRGASRAAEPYLFFCDDDVIVPPDLLPVLKAALERDPTASLAYCDYRGVGKHPLGPVWWHRSRPWSASALREGNYVSTMSLWRRHAFQGFDTTLRRFHDWDVALGVAKRGGHGVYVRDVHFLALFLDEGLSSDSAHFHEDLYAVKKKHGLGGGL